MSAPPSRYTRAAFRRSRARARPAPPSTARWAAGCGNLPRRRAGCPAATPAALPPLPRCGSERPREADSRRSVYLSRDAVGANAEQRIESAVVGWRVAELRRFEAGAVGELQPVARAPRVAQVQRLVQRRPRLVERREGSAE